MSGPGRELSAEELADELEARAYPDVALTGLLSLYMEERTWLKDPVTRGRRHAGLRFARLGHGPHHTELRRLGLVEILEPEPISQAHPVRLTDRGRLVAEVVMDRRAERSGRRDVTVRLEGDVHGALQAIARRTRTRSPEGLLAFIAELLAEGHARPGSWEAELLEAVEIHGLSR